MQAAIHQQHHNQGQQPQSGARLKPVRQHLENDQQARAAYGQSRFSGHLVASQADQDGRPIRPRPWRPADHDDQPGPDSRKRPARCQARHLVETVSRPGASRARGSARPYTVVMPEAVLDGGRPLPAFGGQPPEGDELDAGGGVPQAAHGGVTTISAGSAGPGPGPRGRVRRPRPAGLPRCAGVPRPGTPIATAEGKVTPGDEECLECGRRIEGARRDRR